MSDVSANLNELDTFVTRAGGVARALGESISPHKAAFVTFANSSGSRVGPESTALMTQIDGLRDEITELATFVQLVHDALQTADAEPVDGTVTISSSEMEDLMRDAAENAGVDYDEVTSVDEVVEATVPAVGTVPADSGWVGDPVLTATGHFVIDEIDLPMPGRLAALEWPRTYASIADTDVGHGRGWFSWLNAVAEEVADGVAITDQFGRTIELRREPTVPTEFVSADRAVTAELVDGQYVVRWGRRSAHAYETWRFGTDDGRLEAVGGEMIGVTRFRHERGRLVGLDHDSGRSVGLRWQGDHLAGLESSDGRTARFDITDGELREVRSPGCTQRYRHDEHGRIEAVIDADDVVLVELTFDEQGRATQQREHTGGGSRFEYESPRRTFVCDLDGVRRAGYLHDEQGRVIVATGDPLEPLTRQFDAVGRTVHQTNPDGTRFSMTVDRVADSDSGVVERETLQRTGDAVEIFEYDAGERIRRYLRNGHETRYAYLGDSVLPHRVEAEGGWFVELTWIDGCLVRVVDADGVTDLFEYDRNGNIVAATDGAGNRTEFDRHVTGQVAAVRFADGSSSTTRLDDGGQLLGLVDEVGSEIVFETTPAGRLTAVTDPTGGRVELRYDDAGLPVEIVDAAGFSLGVEVDGEHRPQRLTWPDGSSREIERDVAGRVIGVRAIDRIATGDRDRSWSIDRDVRHATTTYSTPGGRSTAFSTQVGAVERHLVRTGSDDQSLLVDHVSGVSSFVDADGRVSMSSLDHDTRTVTGVAPDGAITTTAYTPAGRVRTRVDADGAIEFGYDAAGRVVTRDEGHGPWRFERDVRGRVVAVVSPQGRRQVYGYDPVGRLTSSTLGTAVTTQTFDERGRLVATTYPDGAVARYEWGRRGELLTTTDRAGGVTSYEYDDRRRMIALVDPVGGRTTVEYAFDRLPAAITDPAGRRRRFVYDDDGLLVAEYDDDRAIEYELDGRGRRIGVEVRALESGEIHDRMSMERTASGQVRLVVHDGRVLASVPTEPRAWDGGSPQVRVMYDLDGLGSRCETDGFVRTIRRDEVGRRVEVADEAGDESRTRRVVRDAAGSVVAHDDGSRRTEYGFHPSGFLASSSHAGPSTTWDYDAVGRLLVENGPTGRREFRYDAGHRLVDVVGASGSTRISYDASGRRTAETGETIRTYEWDLAGLRACSTLDGRIEFDYDIEGRVQRVTTPRGTTDIVWRTTTGFATPISIGAHQVITDGASVAALRAPDGEVRPIPAPDGPWGELAELDPFDVTWHSFHGLTVGGLVVLGARVYDITTRQFLSPDPQRAIVGSASSSWTYCYAANDPVNRLDPLGLAPLSNEEFERLQNRYSRTQWGNIAKVGIIVVGVALMPTGTGLGVIAAGAAIGAASAGGGELVKQVINNEYGIGEQGYYGDRIIKETVFGAIGGGGGAWMGGSQALRPFIGPASSFTTRVPINFASGAAETTAVELWDAAGLPGSDGSFDPEEIFWGGAASTVGGEIGHGWENRGGASSTPDAPTGPPTATADADVGTDLPTPTADPSPPVHTSPDAVADIAAPELPPPPVATVPEPPVWGLPTTPQTVPDPSRPIKGNADSGIFHTPDSQYYDRTIGEVWFATPEEAIDAGFRPPRR